jgi:hypothetical protein
MLKSTKYLKHYASKKKNPTRHFHKSSVTPGHRNGRKEVEKRIGRQLVSDVKITTTGGNWCFSELRTSVAALALK